MRFILRKPFSWLAVAWLAIALPLAAQQDTTAVDSTAAAESTAAADTITAIPADSITLSDSLAMPFDSLSVETDSTDFPAQRAATSAVKPDKPTRKPPSTPGALPVLVIPWDWDDYTHVTEVGLRHLDTGLEYELEKDSLYNVIWERQKDKELWVWGERINLGDGFWKLDLEKFEPLLTMAAADSIARADSIAQADSIARADSIATADSIALADSLARADSLAAATGAAGAGAPADSSAPAAQTPAAQQAQPAQAAQPAQSQQAAPAGTQPATPADSAKPAAADSSGKPAQAGSRRQGGAQP